MAPDPNELVERIWSGPFDGEVPGQGIVRVGDPILVPAHQAEANPHHFRPAGLERKSVEEIEAHAARQQASAPTKRELLERAAELGIESVSQRSTNAELAEAIAVAEESIAAGGPAEPQPPDGGTQ